jgi:hypothetical protein
MPIAKSKPLKLQSPDQGDLKRLSSTEENYLSYLVGQHLIETNNDVGNLTLTSSGNTLTGSFIDTYFNESVGTHPASSISSSSTTTNLYQILGTASEADSDFRKPIAYYNPPTDGPSSLLEGVHEMSDSDMNIFADRLNARIALSDYLGQFKLGSSSPGGDYAVFSSGIFSDTQTDGTQVDYNIYRRETQSSPTSILDSDGAVTKLMSVKRSGGKTGTFQGLTPMTTRQMKVSLGQRAKTRRAPSNAIGSYQLRSSSQGQPATGSWRAVGTATNTKKNLVQTSYARTRTSAYLRTSTRNYQRTSTRTSTRDFAGDYIGNYERTFTGNYERTFAGNYTGNFIGNYNRTRVSAYGRTRSSSYTGNFIGDYTRNFLGNYSRNFEGGYARAYEGVYSRSFSRNFTGDYTRDFIGDYSRDFTRTSTRTRSSNYAGNFAGNFLGEYSRTSTRHYQRTSTRTRSSNYAGNYAGNFLGEYTRNSTRESTRESIAATFTRNRAATIISVGTFGSPEVDGDGIPIDFFFRDFTRTVYYTGEYSNSPSFLGNYIRNRVSTDIPFSRAHGFSRDPDGTGYETITYYRNINYLGDRTYTGEYTRQRIVGFAGEFTGDFTGDYARTSTRTRITDYARNFAGDFIGDYSRDFIGNYERTSTRTSTRTSARDFAGNFLGEYSRDYSRTRASNYTRTSARDYTRSFEGNYSRDFFGEYSRNYERTRVSSYERTSTRTSSRNFGNSFSRDFIGDYTRDSTDTFSRNRVSAYTRGRVSAYTRDSTRTRTSNYAGDFIGDYSRDFVGNYSRDFVGNYTGTTIGSGSSVIETYTLYVRYA